MRVLLSKEWCGDDGLCSHKGPVGSKQCSERTGNIFWTDANGMELVKRTRYKRSSFVAEELERDTANPIGGNYYPITSSVAIGDEMGSQMIIVTDRGQGEAAAMAGGCIPFPGCRSCAQSWNALMCRSFLPGEWSN